MKAIAIITAAVSGVWVCAATADTVLSVQLMDSARINTEQYRLADIARVEADDALLKKRVAETVVGVAPRMGYTDRVPRNRVARLVEGLHPELHGRIDWIGSERVSVRSGGESLPLQPFIDQARDTLLSKLRRQRTDIQRFEIQPVDVQKEVAVPFGDVTVVSRIAGEVKLNKRMCAWLDIAVNGKHYQTVPVWFSLKAYKPVLVAKHPLAVHQSLGERDVRQEDRDVAGITEPLTDFSSVGGTRWLERPLPEGAVLAADDLEEMPLVRSGQNVRVTLAMGPVHIETDGIAQVHGRMGDIVRVQNTDSKGIYAARVTGLGEVTVSAR